MTTKTPGRDVTAFTAPEVNAPEKPRIVLDEGLLRKLMEATTASDLYSMQRLGPAPIGTAGASGAIADPRALQSATDLALLRTVPFGVAEVDEPSEEVAHAAEETVNLATVFGQVNQWMERIKQSAPQGMIYLNTAAQPGAVVTNVPDVTVRSLRNVLVHGGGNVVVSNVAGGLETFRQFNVDPLTLYRSARRHAEESRAAALADIQRRLDDARASYMQRPPREILSELTDGLGVSQLAISRAVGVTPTAVRKWRRGEQARPDHRDRLSRLAALGSLLDEVGLHDPAGWIDIPISGESTLTPLDLLLGNRAGLVVLLGSGLAGPQEILDAFDPNWRTEFAPDRDYRVVRLADGSRSAVPRRGTGD